MEKDLMGARAVGKKKMQVKHLKGRTLYIK